MNQTRLTAFRDSVESELRSNILPFWLEYGPDYEYGGFRGHVSNDLTIDPLEDKGIILTSRILWTFAHAFRVYRDDSFMEMADRAYRYIRDNFLDEDYDGVFWTLGYRGKPYDTKKRIYAHAFALYGVIEFYLAIGIEDVLKTAIDLFNLIEDKSRDRVSGGYFETYERDWKLAKNQRLSKVDQNVPKSMNTHLHVLEAYASLARATNYAAVKESLRKLIDLFLDHILDSNNHFKMFFDKSWKAKSKVISFGHDIEGSWLLCEAAEVIDDPALLARVRDTSVKMAQAVYDEAIDNDGAVLYEAGPSGIIDDSKEWWPQAEAVVGFINAYQLSGREHFLIAAERCWQFINQNIIDKTNGEWFWKVSRNGVVDNTKPKVDQWKCPYHNSRMCFEVLSRIDSIMGKQNEPK